MKKLITFVAVLAMVLPFSAMAMTPITDMEMADVTGQSGVSINADITMDVYIDTVAWGDSDGLTNVTYAHGGWGTTGAVNAGYVGISGLDINTIVIKARLDSFCTLGADATLNPFTVANDLHFITIDVAQGVLHGGATFVRIGLGSLLLTVADMSGTVALSPDDGTDVNFSNCTSYDDLQLNEVLGLFYLDDINVYVDPVSYIDIFADGACGVALSFNVVLNGISIDTLAWGDTDGAGTAGYFGAYSWNHAASTTHGWVGLEDLMISQLEIVGAITIDVSSVSVGSTTLYGVVAAHMGQLAVSFVRIGFAEDLTVKIAEMEGKVCVGYNSDFSAAINSNELGDFYLSGLDLDIYNGSWVDIFGH